MAVCAADISTRTLGRKILKYNFLRIHVNNSVMELYCMCGSHDHKWWGSHICGVLRMTEPPNNVKGCRDYSDKNQRISMLPRVGMQ